MEESAAALRAERRHDATRALDRARRLARFADTAQGLAPEGSATFRTVRQAVEQGRHALQVGRSEEAADILATGARTLANAPLGASQAHHPDPEKASEIVGRPVLNARGEELGSIESVAPGRQEVLIAAGGIFGICLGAHTLQVPADAVLIGKEYAVTLEDPTEVSRNG
ncbi:MAG: PRC-barrel domain-containing protein [Alphaproteobacteria bacterium]|nr:PRC-barrel domain-containing protein [Alphaproteobacteria bacterium]